MMKKLQTLWVIMMAVMLLGMVAENLKASQSNGYEDYSSEIGIRFGDFLREAQLETGPWILPKTYKIFFTSYNPVVWQTDGDPCTGAHGTNVCELNKNGTRTIALSQDLIGEYKYGERIYLYSDNLQCEGWWQLEDTMNRRYRLRGDLFQATKATNTSCTAYITSKL